MAPRADEYAQHVTHPRYGRRPRVTGLNPASDYSGDVFLHWHSPKERRIRNTAIAANLSLQAPATIPVTHYFDVKRECRDCGKAFIFFAEEQRFWYEELGFPLESDCVRCVPCRKTQQGTAAKRERYEELFHATHLTVDQNLEMADCCLSMVEEAVFHRRQLERVRMLLKSAKRELHQDPQERLDDLWARLLSLEAERAPR